MEIEHAPRMLSARTLFDADVVRVKVLVARKREGGLDAAQPAKAGFGCGRAQRRLAWVVHEHRAVHQLHVGGGAGLDDLLGVGRRQRER